MPLACDRVCSDMAVTRSNAAYTRPSALCPTVCDWFERAKVLCILQQGALEVRKAGRASQRTLPTATTRRWICRLASLGSRASFVDARAR